VTALEKTVIDRGRAPEFIRCDNGPELTAHALVDWCKTAGAGTHYINPGSSWQNAWIESFNSKLRDECLAVEEFNSLLEAHIVIADWRYDYNDYRPHSALGMLTPTEFAAREPQPTLSYDPDQQPEAGQTQSLCLHLNRLATCSRPRSGTDGQTDTASGYGRRLGASARTLRQLSVRPSSLRRNSVSARCPLCTALGTKLFGLDKCESYQTFARARKSA
jgi:putative transposase